MRRPLSITLRLALAFSAASSLVLLLVGALVARQVDGHFEELDLEALHGKMLLIGHSIAKLRAPPDVDALGSTLADALVGHDQLAVAVIGADGGMLFATPGVEFPPALRQPQQSTPAQARERSIVWSSGERRFRGMAAALPTGMAAHPPLTVAAAIDMEPHHAFMVTFRTGLLGSVLGGIGLTVLLSFWAARRGLMPVHAIARVAKRISADRLDERLPVAAVPAELVDLAQAFNDMLARLEASFQRLTDFSSDIAHELRTPITNGITQVQVVLSTPRARDDYREVLYSVLEEQERLARMIGDMLYLAKAENGLMMPGSEALDLALEVRSLFDFYEAYVEERGVALALEGQGVVVGDRLMMHRAIGNLLSNAIRHTARGGTVTVELNRDAAGTVSLSVENPGPDIAPEHLPRLFDRFYQVDTSRKQSGDGAGLGLAITRSIVRAHGGTIQVASSSGVTRFTIVFPKSLSLPSTPGSSPSA